MRRRRSQPGGSNLVETLVASVILSGAVLTLSAISTNALTSTRLYRHHEVAASLIDRQLSLIDYTGIDQFIEADDTGKRPDPQRHVLGRMRQVDCHLIAPAPEEARLIEDRLTDCVATFQIHV